MEVAVRCRWCLVWHHHKLTAPPNFIDYYQSRCYARPHWYDRGRWVEPTSTPQARVYGDAWCVRQREARLLAAGKPTASIRRRQATAPELEPLPPRMVWPEGGRVKRPRLTVREKWPTWDDDEDQGAGLSARGRPAALE
ncbi:hypothetical protein ACGFZS_05570 [Streptomyces sp. NPDC048288]|uniref:hypothetical protein n=1 Tax=Streptomyces sp. NPDC048288 TaxID=3365529 RepID=UPI0037158B69